MNDYGFRDAMKVYHFRYSIPTFGNVSLHGKPISKLPNGLIVEGNLDLRGTDIKQLPKNMMVGGNLDLRETSIKRLPKKRHCLRIKNISKSHPSKACNQFEKKISIAGQ